MPSVLKNDTAKWPIWTKARGYSARFSFWPNPTDQIFTKRDFSYVVPDIWPECSRTGWQGKFSWLYPGENIQEVDQGPVGVITLPALLGSVVVWSQQNYLKLVKNVRYFGLLPLRPSPEGKRVLEWMNGRRDWS